MAGGNNKKSAAEAPEAPKPVNPFIAKEVRVGLKDGRYFTGIVASFQGNGDLVLLGAVEFREFSDSANNGVKETGIKQSGLLAIPFTHIATMHKRVDGLLPVSEHINNRLMQQQQMLQQREAAEEGAAAVQK
jgi:small nuclear ribonucleoprotein (snRNP)-like protein